MIACSPVSTDQRLDSIQEAIDCKDYSLAQSICDELSPVLMDTSEPDALHLSRLALLQMEIAVEQDDDENIAQAYEFCKAAFRADSLQASEYFNSVDIDNMPIAMVLISIANRIDDTDDAHPAVPSGDSVSISQDSI